MTWFCWFLLTLGPAAAMAVLGVRTLRGSVDARADFREISEFLHWLAPGLTILAGRLLALRTDLPTGRISLLCLSAYTAFLLAGYAFESAWLRRHSEDRVPLRTRIRLLAYDLTPAVGLGVAILGQSFLWNGDSFAPSIELYIWVGMAMYAARCAANRIIGRFGKFERLAPCELFSRIREIGSEAKVRIERVHILRGSPYNWVGALSFGPKSIALSEALVEQFSKPEVDSVVAHEVGHSGDRRYWVLYQVLHYGGLLIILAAGALLQRKTSSEAAHTAIWLMLFVAPPLLHRVYTRFSERVADRVMLRLSDPRAVISSHYKLALLNNYPTDRPVWARMLSTHPQLSESARLAADRLGITPREMDAVRREAEADLRDAVEPRYEVAYHSEAERQPLRRRKPNAWLAALSFIVGIVFFAGCIALGGLSTGDNLVFAAFAVLGAVGCASSIIVPKVFWERRHGRALRRQVAETLAEIHGREAIGSLLLVDAAFEEDLDDGAWQGAVVGVRDGDLLALGETRKLGVPVEQVEQVRRWANQNKIGAESQMVATCYRIDGVRQWLMLRPLGRPQRNEPLNIRQLQKAITQMLTDAGASLVPEPRLTRATVVQWAWRAPVAAAVLAGVCWATYWVNKATGLEKMIGSVPVVLLGVALLTPLLAWVADKRETDDEAEAKADQPDAQ